MESWTGNITFLNYINAWSPHKMLLSYLWSITDSHGISYLEGRETPDPLSFSQGKLFKTHMLSHLPRDSGLGMVGVSQIFFFQLQEFFFNLILRKTFLSKS